jgi:LPXTG-motif cell wall-anchored protein
VIDGKTYTPDNLDTTYNTANVMIQFDIPAADAQGEADDTESAPATGDNNMLMAWAMLAVMGAAGAMFVRRREN